MKKLSSALVRLSLCSTLLTFAGMVHAEVLIKKETLSFEKCLTAIEMTSEQVAITPRLTADTPNLRIAEYDLTDGILMIRCDKKKKEVRISSK